MWASAIRMQLEWNEPEMHNLRSDLEFLKRVKKLLRHPAITSKQAKVTAVLCFKQIRCAVQHSFIFFVDFWHRSCPMFSTRCTEATLEAKIKTGLYDIKSIHNRSAFGGWDILCIFSASSKLIFIIGYFLRAGINHHERFSLGM